MARVTVEDCLEHVENRYELVHLTAKRVKQLREGDDAQVRSKNKEVVTALRLRRSPIWFTITCWIELLTEVKMEENPFTHRS